MLVVLACGLFLLCGLCFVFGYAVGHRNSGESATAGMLPPASAPGQTQVATSQAKPSAAQSGVQPQQSEAADVSTAAAADAAPVTAGQSGSSPAQSAAVRTTAPGVQTALQTPSVVAPPVPGGGARVEPALPQAESIMVQIAAVSHVEDAQVLVGALRKRGYAVTVRRDVVDGLTHVQVGPFNNRNDANAMRLKLLNDGYNAIVQ
jgi:cell division septation protein DedD